MEPVGHEKNMQVQPVLSFKCEKILSRLDNSSPSAAKIINKEKCKSETNEEVFASPTPVKAPQPSRRSKKLEEVKQLEEVKLPIINKEKCKSETNEEVFASPTPVKAPQPSRRSKKLEEVKQLEEVKLPIINKEKCKSETNEEVFASPTPVKATQPSRRSKKLEEVKFPDKFQIVVELFDGLETSVRLLRLCKKPITFQNVCRQVEILTKRKLLYTHLAQMKYVMTEFIRLESTFVHDQKSFCMLPDVKITLLPSTSGKTETFNIRPEAGESKSLRDIFCIRLRKIILDHPEVIDIPEATLPEPFNSNSDTFANEATSSVATDSTAGMPWKQSSSFKQRFSNVLQRHQEVSVLSSPAPGSVTGTGTGNTNSFMKHSSPIKQESVVEKIGSSWSAASATKPHLGQCSPVGHPSTPVQNMPKIAAQGTPKGSAEIKTVININRRRSLKFTCENADGDDSEQVLFLNKESRERGYSTFNFVKLVGPSVDNEASGRIPPAFLTKDIETANKMTAGRKLCEASIVRHEQQMHLTDLFSTICRILQSAKCSYFTKQELLHKILFYGSETFETSEIEEKLKLLEKLAPEWISQKIASSGDLLYCFRKGSDTSAIYARLGEAA